MYLPDHFKPASIGQMQDLVDEHPFGTLVMRSGDSLDADHLPFLLERTACDSGILMAHISRSNPLCSTGDQAREVLVIFSGEHAYVSPSYYASKQRDHKVVPTWNYRVVHVQGTLLLRDDPKFVQALVGRMTRRFEASQPVPWKMKDAPAEFLQEKLKGIVGLEIRITRWSGKFKLGQNKPAADVRSSAKALERSGYRELSREMQGPDTPR